MAERALAIADDETCGRIESRQLGPRVAAPATLGTWGRLALLLALVLLPALAAAPAAAREPSVIVTIKPVHALVAAVMEGAGTPTLLLDGAASPHAYALKPSEVRALHAADMIVQVSESLETFLARPLAQLPDRVVVLTLDRTPGLTLHPIRTHGLFKDSDHSHAGHSHGHSHAHAHGASGDAKDPHIWLDPANARRMAAHLAEALGRIAPAHADRYATNAETLSGRLGKLEASLAARLAPLADRPYLVFHDAYQYFEQRFGLAPAGSVTVNPDVPPSARRLREIRARLKKSRAVCVFAEPQFAPRVVDTVIEGTKARRGTLDPLGAALKAGPGQYFALLEGLAESLEGCLKKDRT